MPHRFGRRARLLPARRGSPDGSASHARGVTLVTPRDLNIRRARPEDRDAIARLYLQLKHHHGELVPDAARYQVDDQRWAGMALDALADEAQIFFVAELAEETVGFVRFFYEEKSFGTACEVETLVVDPAQRGHGIGDALMARAEGVAHEAGATAMRVNVLHINDDGRRFYERHGYRPVAVRYGKDL